MRTAAVFALLLVVAACNGHARALISKITPVPTLATVGLAPSPIDTPAPLDGSPNVEHDKRLALKAGLCKQVQAKETIAGTLYIGCRQGGVTAADGVVRGRAYIDDWCCFGRCDVYRPATTYSISLQNGTKSERIDLRPHPQAHPGNQQPLGQGEYNYLVGHYLYVVVGFVTYRYDILDLRKPPRRLA